MENRDTLPFSKALMRGCEMPQRAAATACAIAMASIAAAILRINSARTFRFAASLGEGPRSAQQCTSSISNLRIPRKYPAT